MNPPPYTNPSIPSVVKYIEKQLERTDLVCITRLQAYAILEALKNAGE